MSGVNETAEQKRLEHRQVSGDEVLAALRAFKAKTEAQHVGQP